MKSFMMLSLFFLQLFNLFGLWSNDSQANMAVCDTTGRQILPHIGTTSDNKTFVSWIDGRNQNDDVYVQLLDPLGNKLFSNQGLLINNYPRISITSDYSVLVDNDDNFLIAYSYSNEGEENCNTLITKINQTGEKLWGQNGISLSGGFYSDTSLNLCRSGEDIIIGYQRVDINTNNSDIMLQRMTSEGNLLWGNSGIIINHTETENFRYPVLIPSDNNSIIVVYTGQTGPIFTPFVKIYAQKFSENGLPLWAEPKIITDMGTISSYQKPVAKTDGDNGAVIAWYDDRNHDWLFSSFLQRIDSDGNFLFSQNGIEGSLNQNISHNNPEPFYNPQTGEAYLFWVEAGNPECIFAVYGQKFTIEGREWSDNGMELEAFTSCEISSIRAIKQDNNILLAYKDETSSPDQYSRYFGRLINQNGLSVWDGGIVVISDCLGAKSGEDMILDNNQTCKYVWVDSRYGVEDIFIQTLNANGTLGVETGNNDETELPIPQKIKSYPNPFSKLLNIELCVEKDGRYSLGLYNIKGQKVETLLSRDLSKGSQTIKYLPNKNLSSGIYFLMLRKDGELSGIDKIIILK